MALVVPGSFVFIHVQKTGGTWCREMIHTHFPKVTESGPYHRELHHGFRELRQNHPELLLLQTFGFVRHPFTWYPSRWAWAKLTQFAKKMHDPAFKAKHHWMASVWDENFDTFMDNVIRIDVPRATEMFRDKLMHRDLWLADIGLYERLAEDLFRFTGLPTDTIQLPIAKSTRFLDIDMSLYHKKAIGYLEAETILRFYS
jgi:hypothetical protein